MTPEVYASELDKIVEDAVKRLNAGLSTSSRNAYNKILDSLRSLEVNPDGSIRKTTRNLNIISRLDSQLQSQFVTDAYRARVKSFTSAFTTISTTTEAYAAQFDTGGRIRMATVLRDSAINNTLSELVGSGLDNNFRRPLSEQLIQNVTSGGSYAGMNEQLRQFILGDDQRFGFYERYVRQISRDNLMTFSRTYMQTLVDSDWFKYVGIRMDDTREFCSLRLNKFYHRKEIERWAALDWAGKRQGTSKSSIFFFCGGYNCGHELIPVSEDAVPDEARSRVRTGL